ncbi:FAD-dependent oxidoreductase [Desulfovibrio aminophilus]|uniref:NAD(P)/FAD-dependent oxidoreductase n=1 Tax=Desulfovibrio aminophilus TaxID=81425 RepID=UPI003398692A
MTYVIIGNGVASIGAIEGIRKLDQEGTIVVLGSEHVPAYGRPLISYLLAGKIGPERLNLRSDDFYRRMCVDLRLNTTATAIDTKKKTVTTNKGEVIPYDRLLLATGGVPFNPPIPGSEGPDIYNFTNLDHAQALIAAAKKLKRAVVIGGGLIGLKAAESLFDRGVDVTILELSSRVLSAAFDENAGRLAARRLAETGIGVRCGVTAKEIHRDDKGHVMGVLTTDGMFVPCEAVIVAIGVVPNSALAKAAGIKTDRGVLVDDQLQTGTKGVYAAGDVAQARDMITEDNRVVPIWPNAYNQGYYAGRNMAGAGEKYEGGLAMNSISFYGLPTVSVGQVNPPKPEEYEIAIHLDEKRQTYRKLVFKDDRLVGYVLVGEIDNAGMYTSFIKFRMPLPGDAKRVLMHGEPGVFLWPEQVFEKTWNPAGGDK